jgi:hypothetical protein
MVALDVGSDAHIAVVAWVFCIWRVVNVRVGIVLTLSINHVRNQAQTGFTGKSGRYEID